MITSEKVKTRLREIEARYQADPDQGRYLEELTRLREEVDTTINLIIEKSQSGQ